MTLENRPSSEPTSPTTSACQTLNDALRQHLIGGEVVMTAGVKALGQWTMNAAVEAIRNFEEFSQDNDPHNEHDFGEVVVNGQRVWFKIDAYDNDLRYGSPDPTDPNVTTRVMTILLPEEY